MSEKLLLVIFIQPSHNMENSHFLATDSTHSIHSQLWLAF